MRDLGPSVAATDHWHPRIHTLTAYCTVFLLLIGCVAHRPPSLDLSAVPAGNPLPIDGVWQNKGGGKFRIEKGREYSAGPLSDGAPLNSVIMRDIRKVTPGHYVASSETYNMKKHLSAFGPSKIDIVATNQIRIWIGPNPQTDFSGDSEGTPLWSIALDDEQAFLREIVDIPGASAEALVWATSRMTDQAYLARLATTGTQTSVRRAAVERLEDGNILASIAMADSESRVRQAAVARVTDQTLLADLVIKAEDWDIREKAFGRLEDEAMFSRVALNGPDKRIRTAAIARLTDQAFLAGVAIEAADWDIRKAALGKLQDEAMLNKVAEEAPDEAVRTAARVRSGKDTWAGVLGRAAKDERKLGAAISAIALADKQEEVSDQVTFLCHRYIRKADTARIPELKELLRLYGTKELAEDYLNCGQHDLYAAGQSWGQEHGYNVMTGPGSNRVRWGEGR
jgi:hypothetical protein